ncbi:hypothetical protein [Acinetobacter larvae]|uniref:J domain-containing protein n=1 Tax=Acinetobacter larvae TaxID=1789224 RepID=A0A1B2LYK0_9GAMM|nr:hypothetical protein [Acinetobacter larvae]AOA58005.1 hypothetical protein BFG52_06335 [Acinetobacter larvae]
MTCWQRLAIAPTADLRAIKRAYAKQLKKIDQDTQTEAFIALREALEHAQYAAQYVDVDAESPDGDQTQNDDIFQTNFLSADAVADAHVVAAQDARHDDGNFEPNQQPPEQLVAQQYAQQQHCSAAAAEHYISEQLEQLQQHIVQRDVHFDFIDALQHFKDELLLLPPDRQHGYLAQLIDFLVLEDLADFVDLLQVQDSPIRTPRDESHSTIDAQSSVESLSSIELQPSVEPLPSIETVLAEAAETDQVLLLLEQVTDALWQQDVEDDCYTRFNQLLAQLPQLVLTEQIYIKDQLLAALAQVEHDSTAWSYMRFLLRWYQDYPEDASRYVDDEDAVQLQRRILAALQHQRLWDNIPKDCVASIALLSGDQPFKPLQMLKLQQMFAQRSTKPVIEQIMQLQLHHVFNNGNYLFLKSINQWKHYLWANILFVVSSYFFIKPLGFINQLGFFLLVGAFLYVPCILAPLHAYLCRGAQYEDRLERLSLFWFLSGVGLLVLSSHIHPWAHHMLTYVWLSYSLILLTALQLVAHPYMNQLLQSAQLKIDQWMIIVGSICVSACVAWLFYHVGATDYPWLIVFSLIPLALLLMSDSLSQMAYRFGSYDPDRKYPALRNFAIISLRCAVILGYSLWFSHPKSQPTMLLASMCFISLILAMVQMRYISSILKYLAYIVLIALTLPSVIIPIILIYYVIKSCRLRHHQPHSI